MKRTALVYTVKSICLPLVFLCILSLFAHFVLFICLLQLLAPCWVIQIKDAAYFWNELLISGVSSKYTLYAVLGKPNILQYKCIICFSECGSGYIVSSHIVSM